MREFAPSESRLIMFEPAIVKEIVFGHQKAGISPKSCDG